MSHFIKIFLLIFSTNVIYSQVVYVEEWCGNWEAFYYNTTYLRTGNSQEFMSVTEKHKKRFVHIDINGFFVEDQDTLYRYSREIFLTFNLDYEAVKDSAIIYGLMIDDLGYKGIMIIKGYISDNNEITLRGESLVAKYRSVWKLLNTTELIINTDYIFKEENKDVTISAKYTRR